MTIIGLDISLTGTGACRLVVGSDARPSTALFGTSSKQTTLPKLPDEQYEMHRYGTILDRVKTFVMMSPADLVVIENFAFSALNAGARSTAGISYLIRYWLYAVAKIPFVLVAPAQLKKFCTGKAMSKGPDQKMHGVSKDVIIRELSRLWNLQIDNNNECDAVVLAKIGEGLFSYQPAAAARAEVVAAQKAVIGELRKANPWLQILKTE